MKRVFLVLLLINSIFLAWLYHAGGESGVMEEHAEDPLAGEHKPLVLVSERNGDKAATAKPHSAMAEIDSVSEDPAAKSPTETAVAPAVDMAEPAPETETQALSSVIDDIVAKVEPAEKAESANKALSEPKTSPPSSEKKMSPAPQVPMTAPSPAVAPVPSPEPVMATKPASVDTKTPPKPKFCYRYRSGPFISKSRRERFARAAVKNGLSIEGRWKKIHTIKARRLFLPPSITHSGAEAKLRQLKSRGLKDVEVITSGDKRWGISLGVYATDAGFNKRLQQLQKQGLSPQVEDVTVDKSRYWLNMASKDKSRVSNKTIQRLRSFGNVGIKEKKYQCK